MMTHRNCDLTSINIISEYSFTFDKYFNTVNFIIY